MSPDIEGGGPESDSQQARVDAATEKSERHQNNEDGYLISSPSNVVAIFDGVSMGGKGKFATDAAIESFKKQITPLGNNQTEIEANMRKMFFEANSDVINNEEGGKTTASAAYIWTDTDGRRHVTIGHVGDTRIYLVAPNGETEIKQLTTDHRVENTSTIYQVLGDPNGINQIEIKTFYLPTEAEQIILTTDGVHDNLSDQELLNVINQPKKGPFSRLQTPTTLAKRIVHTALNRSKNGGKIDDITAVVIEIPPAQKSNQKGAEAPAPAPAPTPPSVEQKIQVGKIVRVQRTDGTFNNNWVVQEIVTYENGEQFAKVELENNTKLIPLKKLERLNRPAKFEDIDEAENYEQIWDVLHQLDDRNKPDQNIENAISAAIVQLRDPNTQADISVFRNIKGLNDAQKEILQKAAIRLAPNMNDLIRILPSAVLGSNGTLYEKAMLVKMIRIVLREQEPEHKKDEYLLTDITNIYGIRDAVIKLYNIKYNTNLN